MIAWFSSLADRIRPARAFAGEEVRDGQGDTPSNSGAALLRGKRLRVAIWAALFGLFAGAIDLPLPVEDLYRAVRAAVRQQQAPQDIAMIAIDDKTIDAFNGKLPDRAADSRIIDRLASEGVGRIVFDRAQASAETPAGDALFTSTLARHKGKVWLGMVPSHRAGFQTVEQILPRPEFRREANLAMMNASGSPFFLSIRFKSGAEFEGRQVPALSAALAEYAGPDRVFRPDYAFDPRTVPTFSYVDVLEGRITAKQLAGKNVVIGETFYQSSDFYHYPLSYGRIPGAYFHIMGAHTLKRGTPVDLKWYPALALAAAMMVWLARGQSRSQSRLVSLAIGLAIIPLLLDDFGVNLDIMPALLALIWAGIGFQRINRKYFRGDVDAMNTTAISSQRPSPEHDVYALKIANLAELSEDWSVRETGDFVNTLISYVKGPSAISDVAFERDLLVWLAPRMDTVELERHADGLALMLKTAISHDWQSSNNAAALGIDTNHDLPVAQRIKKAMQAADEAAQRGARFIINDAAYLEARNQRLEMIRILERGLRERDIKVAYQPKIDLASGRIVGAETLIRWKPDGQTFVDPQELVLAAEAGDRINELTLVVLETALVDGKRALALDPRFKLAVNMSAKSLSDTHLLFDIMTMLGRYHFPPENLTLELTETAKLEDQRIAPQVAALKARGIGLSIDDFGTGQSNLEYIEKLPSSELKIDKRFVQHMATSEESRAVVRATIEIAHSLGKTVVAEGVEDFDVAATLKAMGCDQAQGYLFSRAITMPELLAMMDGGRAALNT
ncbi:EAL domain-containing protein [Erythrobacter sp. WG]|uniref:EAL domain-containing protein n=1 Tax=Erythrobacter sp. WG TaxID=2985510 RepID=UPI002271E243|nr:EAL domain-containing protein [Erythrobacter sp. WG]MCX9148679.1 EAL domain-containing protein [Erythrobacter sp. WG]